MRRLSCGPPHHIQHILAVPEDIPLLHCLGDRKPVDIDDAVALCGVDGQHRIHGRVHFLPIHGGHIHGRSHEGYRLMGLGGRVRTDLCAEDHIPLQAVSPGLHIQQLGGYSQRAQRTVPIRNKARHFRSCTDAPQPAHNPECGCCPAGGLSGPSGHCNPNKIRRIFPVPDGPHRNFRRAPALQLPGDLLAGCRRTV